MGSLISDCIIVLFQYILSNPYPEIGDAKLMCIMNL